MDWLDALVGRVVERVLGHADQSSDEATPYDYREDDGDGDDFPDDDSSSSGDSQSHDDSTQDQTLRALRRVLRRDSYFDALPLALRQDECDAACYFFDAFRRERRLQAQQQYPHQGLEYLMDAPARQKLPSRAWFWGQHIEPQRRAKPVHGHTQVFVVRRELDYVYSYVIEQALWLGSHPSEEMKRARQFYREQKQLNLEHAYRPSQPHNERFSPDTHLLYMRRDCALFQYCERVMLNDAVVDYERATGAWAVESLSFCLVNFLCHVTPAQELQEVEQCGEWVAAPLFYLTLWNSGFTPTK